MPRQPRRPNIAQVIAAAYTVLLTYLLLTPDPLWFLPASAEAVEETVDVTISTYVQHVLSYFILVILLGRAYSTQGRPSVRHYVWPAVAHGMLTEWLQRFVPERFPSWSDLMFNLLGVAAGWAVVATLYRMRGWSGLSPAGLARRR